jgi:hypothetical protein
MNHHHDPFTGSRGRANDSTRWKRESMTRGSLVLLFVATGCGGIVEPEEVRVTAAARYAVECEGESVPPVAIECTGMYADLKKKELADGVLAYAPAVPLWSDGAEKERFIQIPKGKKIDASDPNEWRFPVGTKVWKEFRVDGKRVETRLFEKTLPNSWVRATYEWNEDDTKAQMSLGGDVPSPDGGTYHIPKGSECDECHRGRTDRVLGFEEVSLGLPGAKGVTLDDLIEKKLISPVPARTKLEIGDDGTGLAAGPLGWLHINCGTTCHNGNTNSTAYGATMRLRLDPTELDGRSVSGFESLKTTVGKVVNTPTWFGQKRIVPGDPSNSLLVKLITTRTAVNPESTQMPPIASRVVDKEHSDAVIAWIAAMPPNSGAGGD